MYAKKTNYIKRKILILLFKLLPLQRCPLHNYFTKLLSNRYHLPPTRLEKYHAFNNSYGLQVQILSTSVGTSTGRLWSNELDNQ